MTLNVGSFDRVLRAIIGLAIVAYAFLGGLPAFGWLAMVLAAAGVILVVTAFMSWCPIYATLGLGTRRSLSGR